MSGQLIRQSAFPIQGGSSFIKKAKTLSLFACFGFSACSSLPHTAQPDVSSQPAAPVSKPANKLEASHPARKLPASRQLATALPSPRKTPTEPPASTVTLVAVSLGSSYQILKADANSLSVCQSPRAAKIKSSLFEEAIVLAKIRSALKKELPKKPTFLYEVQFHDGTAVVAFRSDASVKTLTSAIVKILRISGVNRVDATFPSPPPTALKN